MCSQWALKRALPLSVPVLHAPKAALSSALFIHLTSVRVTRLTHRPVLIVIRSKKSTSVIAASRGESGRKINNTRAPRGEAPRLAARRGSRAARPRVRVTRPLGRGRGRSMALGGGGKSTHTHSLSLVLRTPQHTGHRAGCAGRGSPRQCAHACRMLETVERHADARKEGDDRPRPPSRGSPLSPSSSCRHRSPVADPPACRQASCAVAPTPPEE